MKATKKSDFTGHYTIVYSPEDGGYYVDRWWIRRNSPTFNLRSEAVTWALNHGGTTEHAQP
jgi:hypothetical protein